MGVGNPSQPGDLSCPGSLELTLSWSERLEDCPGWDPEKLAQALGAVGNGTGIRGREQSWPPWSISSGMGATQPLRGDLRDWIRAWS